MNLAFSMSQSSFLEDIPLHADSPAGKKIDTRLAALSDIFDK